MLLWVVLYGISAWVYSLPQRNADGFHLSCGISRTIGSPAPQESERGLPVIHFVLLFLLGAKLDFVFKLLLIYPIFLVLKIIMVVFPGKGLILFEKYLLISCCKHGT